MIPHEYYIKRCIQLAKNGLGTTYPNPMVGCVIVYDGRIIGEGWHHKAGTPHAEVHAINSVHNKALLEDATIYVSLEPCSHFGKTPPCSTLIIHSGIKKVVIGTVDPFVKVAGRGIKKLRAAGCEVIVGVLEQECQALNQRFFTFHTQKRPYIILKWAESHDGFISPDPKTRKAQKPVWITNALARQLVHQWRTQEQAILIGTTTAIADNPQLNARDWHGANPVRIVIDHTSKIPITAAVFDDTATTIRLISKEKTQGILPKNVHQHTIDFTANVLHQIMNILFDQELQSVIIEGGRQTLQSFIDANLWDEARVFTGALHFGSGIKAPKLQKSAIYQQQKLGSDLLNIYGND